MAVLWSFVALSIHCVVDADCTAFHGWMKVRTRRHVSIDIFANLFKIKILNKDNLYVFGHLVKSAKVAGLQSLVSRTN